MANLIVKRGNDLVLKGKGITLLGTDYRDRRERGPYI